MDDDIDTEALVERPKKGLSPIARIKKGEPFWMLELHMVLIAELQTGNKNITVSACVALSGVPGVPMQAPHFDDWLVKTLVASVPLNMPSD